MASPDTREQAPKEEDFKTTRREGGDRGGWVSTPQELVSTEQANPLRNPARDEMLISTPSKIVRVIPSGMFGSIIDGSRKRDGDPEMRPARVEKKGGNGSPPRFLDFSTA